MLVILSASVLAAQTRSEDKPAREKLNYFLGTWTIEMHRKTGALNSHLYSATEQNEWTPDRPLLLSKPEGNTAPTGGSIVVMGYSPSKQVYTYRMLKSTGDSEDLQGTVEDGTWTWLSDEVRTGGESRKTRITVKEIAPTSYPLRVETFPAGGTRFTVMEGVAKKVVSHSHQAVAFLH